MTSIDDRLDRAGTDLRDHFAVLDDLSEPTLDTLERHGRRPTRARAVALAAAVVLIVLAVALTRDDPRSDPAPVADLPEPVTELGLGPDDEIALRSSTPATAAPPQPDVAWATDYEVGNGLARFSVGVLRPEAFPRWAEQAGSRGLDPEEARAAAADTQCTGGGSGAGYGCGPAGGVFSIGIADHPVDDVLAWSGLDDDVDVVVFRAGTTVWWQRPVDGLVAFPFSFDDWCTTDGCRVVIDAYDAAGRLVDHHADPDDTAVVALDLEPDDEVELRRYGIGGFGGLDTDKYWWSGAYETEGVAPFATARHTGAGVTALDGDADDVCVRRKGSGTCRPAGEIHVLAEVDGAPEAIVWPGLDQDVALVVAEHDGRRRWQRPSGDALGGAVAFPYPCAQGQTCDVRLRTYDRDGNPIGGVYSRLIGD
ncbi:MAG: hypothetical protein S0880_24330 [Actinomycetota bacterium]|nr:hypothetical protein [Actinomycetota bacterium]